MNEFVVNVLLVQREGLSAEPSKALAVDEGLKRVYSRHEDVDSHIELVAVDQERVVDVLLQNHWLGKHHVLQFADQLDPSAPRQSHRL